MDKKNVRKIGQVQGRRKVYIEDYAMTFMKQLAEKNGASAHMAVLVGEYEKKKQEEAFYVYGVVEIPSGDAGIGYRMDSAAWTRVYGDIKQYFPDQNIVGWYLTADEPDIMKNDWLLQFHKENFAGPDKFLFYYDPGELEELCYLYENGQLKRQSGYCLFYEKNEAMQAFLVDRSQNRQQETVRETSRAEKSRQEQPRREASRQEQPQHDADERVVKEIRRTLEKMEKKHQSGQQPHKRSGQQSRKGKQQSEPRRRQRSQGQSGMSSYLAGAVTAAAVLALCLIVFQYFDRLDSLEASIQELTGNLAGVTAMDPGRDNLTEEASGGNDPDSGGVLEIETLPGGIVSKGDQTGGEDGETEDEDGEAEDEDGETEEEKDAGVKDDAGKEEEETDEDGIEDKAEMNASAETGGSSADDNHGADSASGTEKKPDKQETIASGQYYVVQPGDTLSDICQRQYMNIHMVEKVMEANGLTDPNGILAGDVLLLP